MQRWIVGIFCVCGLSPVVACGQSYPTVYGPTGRPYGPTQAAYQYQRQYGRPWHGLGGNRAAVGVNAGLGWVNGAPLGTIYGGYWPGFSSPYPFVAAPSLNFYYPGIVGTFGIYNYAPGGYLPYPDPAFAANAPYLAPLDEAWEANVNQWGQALPQLKADPVQRMPQPSSNNAKLRSLRAQAHGDEHARKSEWNAAYQDYKLAIEAAGDRAEAHFRLGVALTAAQHYERAAQSFKRALFLEPQLPEHGVSIANILGPESQIARTGILERLVKYVEQDIRDPDRLFVLGVMLHFEDDPRAAEVLETGLRLAGHGQHFTAFLNPVSAKPAAQQAAEAPALPVAPIPPAPLPQLEGPELP